MVNDLAPSNGGSWLTYHVNLGEHEFNYGGCNYFAPGQCEFFTWPAENDVAHRKDRYSLVRVVFDTSCMGLGFQKEVPTGAGGFLGVESTPWTAADNKVLNTQDVESTNIGGMGLYSVDVQDVGADGGEQNCCERCALRSSSTPGWPGDASTGTECNAVWVHRVDDSTQKCVFLSAAAVYTGELVIEPAAEAPPNLPWYDNGGTLLATTPADHVWFMRDVPFEERAAPPSASPSPPAPPLAPPPSRPPAVHYLGNVNEDCSLYDPPLQDITTHAECIAAAEYFGYQPSTSPTLAVFVNYLGTSPNPMPYCNVWMEQVRYPDRFGLAYMQGGTYNCAKDDAACIADTSQYNFDTATHIGPDHEAAPLCSLDLRPPAAPPEADPGPGLTNAGWTAGGACTESNDDHDACRLTFLVRGGDNVGKFGTCTVRDNLCKVTIGEILTCEEMVNTHVPSPPPPSEPPSAAAAAVAAAAVVAAAAAVGAARAGAVQRPRPTSHHHQRLDQLRWIVAVWGDVAPSFSLQRTRQRLCRHADV